MKRLLGTAALAVFLAATILVPTTASAQCVTGTGTNLLFKWDADGFAYEPGYNQATFNSTAGNTVTVVGILTLWCAPFNALDPADPAKEYTLVMTATSQGTVTSPFGSGGTKYTTVYLNGSFAVYEGTPRNAPVSGAMPINPPNATVPANFMDGTVVLSGMVDSLVTTITKSSFGTTNGSFRGNYIATGGSMVSLLCSGTSAGPGLFNGGWAVTNLPTGYTAHPFGKFDAPQCPTNTAPSSWGRIKSLYR
jgi:hypothetical protein